MCRVSVVLVQCCNNTTLIKISINTGFSARLVQCAVFTIKIPFSVKFLLKSLKNYTTPDYFYYFCSVKALLKAHKWAEAGKTHIHKRRNCTLWFDACELRTFQLSVKTKQPERLMGVLYTSLIGIGLH